MSNAVFPHSARTASTIALICLGLLLNWTHYAVAAPPGFFALNAGGSAFDSGSNNNLALREATWDEIQATGVKSFRMRIDWSYISGGTGCNGAYDFSLYDDLVRRAAVHDVTVIAYLYGMPSGCETGNTEYPLAGTSDYNTWKNPGGFVYRVVQRYGLNGSFWLENQNIPQRPIKVWQVWNETNLPLNNPGGAVAPHKYARFLIDTANAIQSAQDTIYQAEDPRVISAGLPYYSEAAMSPPDYEHAMYTNQPTSGPFAYTDTELHAAFDGFGVHPYALGSTAEQAEERVSEIRLALDTNGDKEKSLWVTELGWAPGYFGTTETMQASYLQQSFSWLANNASKLKIELAAWYFLRDTSSANKWDRHAGLKDLDGSSRQAWCKFLVLNGRSCPLPVASGSTPSVQRDPDSGYIFIAYRNDQGGLSYSYKPPTGSWISSTLTGSNAVAANTNPDVVRDEDAQYTFITYQNSSGRIAYFYWTPGSGWVGGTLGGSLPADAAPGSSPALAWSPTSVNIVYRDTSGGLKYWFWNSSQGWQRMPLGGSVAVNTSPSMSRDPATGYTFIAYNGSTGSLRYMLWAPGSSWSGATLGGGTMSPGTSPSVVRDPSANYTIIAYRNTSNLISYWYWSGGWYYGSFSSGEVGTGASPTVVWDPDYAGIVYRHYANGIGQWAWQWPAGWTNFSLTSEAGLASTSNIDMVRNPANGDTSYAYSNKYGELTSMTWLSTITGHWITMVP